MNLWAQLREFFFPVNAWLTQTWEDNEGDEEPYIDGEWTLRPVKIETTWKAHMKPNENDPSKYMFDNMVVHYIPVDPTSGLLKVRDTFDKIEKVPVRFMKYTDRTYQQKADI